MGTILAFATHIHCTVSFPRYDSDAAGSVAGEEDEDDELIAIENAFYEADGASSCADWRVGQHAPMVFCRSQRSKAATTSI